MPGCYGSSVEDRYFAGELYRHLDREAAQEVAAEMIDQRANDLYRAKLQELPNGMQNSDNFQSRPGYYCWNALDNIDKKHWAAIGRAIRDNDAEVAGKLIIAAVCEVLRNEAQEEAEAE